MKAHIGGDSKSRQIHSVAATAANVHVSQVLVELLHGGETRIYSGQADTIREAAPCAQDFTHEKGRRNHPLDDAAKARNRTKSKVCAKSVSITG